MTKAQPEIFTIWFSPPFRLVQVEKSFFLTVGVLGCDVARYARLYLGGERDQLENVSILRIVVDGDVARFAPVSGGGGLPIGQHHVTGTDAEKAVAMIRLLGFDLMHGGIDVQKVEPGDDDEEQVTT